MPFCEEDVAPLFRSCEELGHGRGAVFRSSENSSFSISSSTSSGQGENPMTLVASEGPARSMSPLTVDANHSPPVFHGHSGRERSPHRTEDRAFGPVRNGGRSSSRSRMNRNEIEDSAVTASSADMRMVTREGDDLSDFFGGCDV